MAGVSLQTRRALLQSMIPQYREASSVNRKSKLLDAFTAATGYNRKYAMCQRLRNFGSPNFLVKSMKIHDGYPVMDLEEKTLTL